LEKIEHSKFSYSVNENGERKGEINGSIQNPLIWWLWHFELDDQNKQSIVFQALQKDFMKIV